MELMCGNQSVIFNFSVSSYIHPSLTVIRTMQTSGKKISSLDIIFEWNTADYLFPNVSGVAQFQFLLGKNSPEQFLIMALESVVKCNWI